MTRPVLYLFGSAAPPVREFPEVVRRAQAEGFEVCVGLTPTAARWLADDVGDLAEVTGRPVRSEYKMPGESDVWPKADVILVAPATFNTLNHWALGLTHHFVVGVIAEGIGKAIPTVTMPCVNAAYVQHPQFDQSIATLRRAGVTVLYGSGGFEPNQPGERRAEGYPWHLAFAAIEQIVSRWP
ncbi:flavoprotein [Streptomyces noursei]|uniref:flavoprotein n=1 Tax=Streptomyces noursei TaxID=1971 RepID=UPI001964F3A2|nr:flavoprotein [Streptomyces noursei]QRX90671.1 flavoprotein [Streptomyces noursei]